MKIRASFFIAFMLLSCSPEMEGNHAHYKRIDLIGRGEQCVETLDIVYNYENGKLPNTNNLDIISDKFILPNLRKYHVHQSDIDNCYAAAASTALEYIGYSRSQGNIEKAASGFCTKPGKQTASLSKIIYGITYSLSDGKNPVWFVGEPNDSALRTLEAAASNASTAASNALDLAFNFNASKNNQGYEVGIPKDSKPLDLRYDNLKVSSDGTGYALANWCLDARGAIYSAAPMLLSTIPALEGYQSQMVAAGAKFIASSSGCSRPAFLPNPYRWVTWSNKKTKKEGGISPIRDNKELLYFLQRNKPILVGININDNLHVVIISELQFRHIRGLPLGGRSITIDHVQYIDPLKNTNQPFGQMDGNTFLENTRFMLALWQNV